MINKLMQFTDRYFTNIGTKLKNWAKWIFIVEAVAALIAAPITALCFWVMAIDSYYYGFEYFLYGCLILLSLPIALAVALVSTWPLYAFGELVERVSSMDENVRLMTIPVRENSRDTIEAAEEAARQAAAEAAAEEARRTEEARAKRKAQMETMTKNSNNMAKQAKQAAGTAAKQVGKELNRRAAEEKARKEALQNYNPAEEAARHKAESMSREEAEENARRVVEERMRRRAEEKAASEMELQSEDV